MDTVSCSNSNCGYNFGAYPNGMGDSRKPCPNCGGVGRCVSKSLNSSVELKGSLEYGGHPAGQTSKRSRFVWGFTGWELSKSLGYYIKKVSVFDKRGNRRFE